MMRLDSELLMTLSFPSPTSPTSRQILPPPGFVQLTKLPVKNIGVPTLLRSMGLVCSLQHRLQPPYRKHTSPGCIMRKYNYFWHLNKKLSDNATRRNINEQSLFAPSTNWTIQEAQDLKDPPFLDRLPIPSNGIFINGTVIRRLFKKDGDHYQT